MQYPKLGNSKTIIFCSILFYATLEGSENSHKNIAFQLNSDNHAPDRHRGRLVCGGVYVDGSMTATTLYRFAYDLINDKIQALSFGEYRLVHLRK